MDIDPIEQIFEFERKFFVSSLPDIVEHANHTLIIQGYVFAEEGYAIRVRVTVSDTMVSFDDFTSEVDRFGAYERRVLAGVVGTLSGAWITVKSPPISGQRYELDQQLEPSVAVSILQRCHRIVIKNRHSLWLGEDGWEIDEFGGQNTGLIIAECERTGPVVGLTIPDFCETEVSSDLRFTNDYLSRQPWVGWGAQFLAELAAKGPYFEEN
ncbi:adenylate cyclase [Flaviflexus huanghaiensis]|uniref:adenylate cyclase n=1 Tax=Flaviflexus huanghaiensis TaxID=1111473 RepID=UPI0015FD222D|nr:adenylate cyclase [Flaviflexus huanghaiensis]